MSHRAMLLHKPNGLTSLKLPIHTPFLDLTLSPLTFPLHACHDQFLISTRPGHYAYEVNIISGMAVGASR